MGAVLGLLSNVFSGVFHRQHISPSNQQLGDVGYIMDEDYYKRDIVIAGKKIMASPYLEERLRAIRDVGHLAWLGGPAAAKFAANHLMEFVALLQEEIVPLVVKKQVLYSVSEICLSTEENKDKARTIGMLELLCELIGSMEPDMRRGATACLVCLVNQNFENYKKVKEVSGIKEKLLRNLQDDWRKWKRNEAARLILMLGLNRQIENRVIVRT